jgi:alpha/beta hydrolase family protein
MRLRRITAISAAVAAVFATTAAVLPGSPADRPQPMPALTARALNARYAADSRLIAKAAATATRAGNKPLAQSLDGMRGHHFIDFNPRGQGLAAEVIGNLATATRVAILVPGSDTSLATFDSRGTASPQGGALALAAQTRRLAPRARLAIIAWLGYKTPNTLSPAVLTSGDAGQGATQLRAFTGDLARHGRQVALLCHSYGSVVCGLAAPRLPVTDIAVVGSPGMDASSVRALHTTARVWAGRGTGDWIRHVPHIQFLGLGFGQDPMAPAFGARIFAAGSGGHSSYFQPGGISLRNLADIALGDAAAVTR